MRFSIKLGVLCAVAAVLPLVIASAIIMPGISSNAREKAAEQLRIEARVAAALYDKRLTELLAAAVRLADEIANRALANPESSDRANSTSGARVQDLFPRAQQDYFLDFIIVTDPLGRVLARHNDRPAEGESLLGADDRNPVIERVITGGTLPAAGCVVERGERYARLGLDRIAQVRLADGSTIDEALMIEAGAPIFSGGRFAGVALIGQMLNTYFKPRARPSGGFGSLQTPVVAEIRQMMTPGSDEDSGALVALGSAVIASSVPAAGVDGNSVPALAGAAHDPSKDEETIRHGDRGYNVAWQPIKALDGSAIGAIGVARPSSEFEGATSSPRSAMFIIGLLGMAAAGAGGFLFGRSLGTRLDRLADAASRWSVGDLSATAPDSEPVLSKWIPPQLLRDELNRLTEQLDETRESFRQAIERMRKRA
jgi:HAMP domain-containing protein